MTTIECDGCLPKLIRVQNGDTKHTVIGSSETLTKPLFHAVIDNSGITGATEFVQDCLVTHDRQG